MSSDAPCNCNQALLYAEQLREVLLVLGHPSYRTRNYTQLVQNITSVLHLYAPRHECNCTHCTLDYEPTAYLTPKEPP